MLESQIKRRYRFKRYVLIKLIVVLALTIVLVIAELLPLAINMLNNGNLIPSALKLADDVANKLRKISFNLNRGAANDKNS